MQILNSKNVMDPINQNKQIIFFRKNFYNLKNSHSKIKTKCSEKTQALTNFQVQTNSHYTHCKSLHTFKTFSLYCRSYKSV